MTKHVAVLMGGMSSEHDVSIVSGTMVVDSLDRQQYQVTPVTITRDGVWRFPARAPMGIYEAVPYLKRLGLDCVFIAMHGPFGEDGRLQGLLDLLGLPYTSSGCGASALAMDKIRAKAVAQAVGIRVADQMVFDRGDWERDLLGAVARVQTQFGFPCVVKSPCEGSSLGMAIPQSPAEFREGVRHVLTFGDVVMVERFVSGVEVTCGVLDIEPGAKPLALPPTEIRPVASRFFDYYAKYKAGATREITPAEISEDATALIQETSVRAHQLIGCTIWTRHDFIIDDQGPVWLEVNTIPGLTPTSLFPQAAAAIGIPYEKLMSLFIEAAIARAETQKGQ
jgi:D-alanine-D-alanine ligase